MDKSGQSTANCVYAHQNAPNCIKSYYHPPVRTLPAVG
jgi:hypothetical protein